MNDDTPSLGDVIKKGAEYVTKQMRTSFLAKVTSFNPDKCTASVVPVNSSRYSDGTFLAPAVIPDLPVLFPSYSGFYIRAPLEEGQVVLVVVADSSSDEWLLGGTSNNQPRDPRRFDIRDGIVLAGLTSLNKVEPLTDDNFHIGIGDNGITVAPDGKMNIQRNGIDLFDIVKDLADAVDGIITATALGPQPVDPATKAKIIAIKTKLDMIKN